ncbi:MAG: DUF2202 domain-containing protein [Deltaproteobacteria bacterium]|jgi:hypothetical protein|nr:DUF2202 domain-containing protein [Deltaproteobacteria bacterium]MBW2498668.1 DUF2202 domain-containing protein [Deltaproteobacteria bacterium]
MTVEEALRAALDDEYKARATYRAVLDTFGAIRPFVNIVESEERHIEALTRLFERHGFELPPDEWKDRVAPPESVAVACAKGVEAEVENAALYEELLEAARGHPDVEETFRNLLSASQENHLPAFERCLQREQHGSGRPGAAAGGHPGHRRRHRGGRGGDR